MQNSISYLWKEPSAPADYTTGVSLHSHTSLSQETLTFIHRMGEELPFGRLLTRFYVRRAHKRHSVNLDFVSAHWCPPLVPRMAWELERDQIQALNLSPLISITDHDCIQAPLLLRNLPESRAIPVSLEWTTSFGVTAFHLGIHNLPSADALAWMDRFSAFTAAPSDRQLGLMLRELHELPHVLIVCNHPLWDLYTVGDTVHRAELNRFLAEHGSAIHALELNGLRHLQENREVADLAPRWNQLLISGGDRHGLEPNANINLTRATTFNDFVHELRVERKSHILFMNQYQTPWKQRILDSTIDAISNHSHFSPRLAALGRARLPPGLRRRHAPPLRALAQRPRSLRPQWNAAPASWIQSQRPPHCLATDAQRNYTQPNLTPYPQSDRELIRLIERSPSARAGYKQLIRELGLGGGRERRLLLEQLERITLRGDLVKINNDQWSLPRATPEKTARMSAEDRGNPDRANPDRAPSNAASPRWMGSATRDRLLAGKLDLHRDGFGFVRPNGSTSREDDLFIPPNELNGAMQGDEVLVDEAPPGRPGPDGKARRSGRIARVLTRRNPTVVGIFHYARGHRGDDHGPYSTSRFNYITPLDARMTQPVLIPNGPDGQPILPTPSTEHRVVGEDAKRTYSLPPTPHSLPLNEEEALPSLPHPLEGLAVDVEITDFPTLSRPAQGRILEVIGHPDDFGVDVEIVIRKHRLPYIFPANVLAEAADSAAQTVDTLSHEDLSVRHDFRGLPIVTIDGETARDFDDAVLVQPLPNGNWQLQVHIADVSHYVRPGTALDLEARLRGTSVYFPDRAVPMLPPALSSGMCSLRPDEDRLVLSCIAEIDQQGEVAEFQLCEGIIRSAKRFTYTTVQKILDGDPETRAAEIALVPAVEQMHALALLLNQKRHRRGSIDFDLPEAVIQFDPQGNMAAITRSERGWSNRLIEEFMLTANECVAHWLEAQGDSIYRIHELPDPKRILDFEETASAYGQSLGFASLPVKQFTLKNDRRSSRANAERHGGRTRAPQQHEVPESIPVTPQMYQRLTAKIAGTPEERILSFLMLRSLKQARYSEKNDGHFALASPSYTHFTSPIRRYPDLIIHRLLRTALRAGANPLGGPILSTDPQPWSSKRTTPERRHPEPGAPSFPASSERVGYRAKLDRTPQPSPDLSLEELAAIALESSQSERRADDAERELMEWKKIKFMQDRVGEDFHATILSCTKYGFFVELDELFIEGLVPIQSLSDSGPFGSHEYFLFRDTDRSIVGQSSGRSFRLGQRVHVILDRIDRPARRLQFALIPSAEPQGEAPRSLRKKKPEPAHSSPTRTGKPGKTKSKARLRDKKSKGKRR